MQRHARSRANWNWNRIESVSVRASGGEPMQVQILCTALALLLTLVDLVEDWSEDIDRQRSSVLLQQRLDDRERFLQE